MNFRIMAVCKINVQVKYEMKAGFKESGNKYWTIYDRSEQKIKEWPVHVPAEMMLKLHYSYLGERKWMNEYQKSAWKKYNIFGADKCDLFAHISAECLYNTPFTRQLDEIVGIVLNLARLPMNADHPERVMPILDVHHTPWETFSPWSYHKCQKTTVQMRQMAKRVRQPEEIWEPTFVYPGYTFTVPQELAMSIEFSSEIGVQVGVTILNGQFLIHFYFARVLKSYPWPDSDNQQKSSDSDSEHTPAKPAIQWDYSQNAVPFDQLWPVPEQQEDDSMDDIEDFETLRKMGF